MGYKTGKWSFIASGNYQHRARSQTSYFEFYRNQWFENPEYSLKFRGDTARNIAMRYPDQDMAMEKYAGNVFVDYEVAKDIKFDLSTGIQHSVVQRVSAENEITPLSTSQSDTRYLDFRANVKGVSAQFAYKGGQQNIDYDPGNKYDFHSLDASIEYNYTRSRLSLKPGLNYRSTIYDDTRYSDIVKKAGIFNARGKLTTVSPSLRIEYKMLNDKLRLVAGLTAHKFNYPDTTYFSAQLGATYKVNKNHLFRAVYSRATRSSNIYDTYVDQTIAFFPSGFQQFTRLALWGNKNMKLLTADMFEVGYRGAITSSLNVDIEMFDIQARNASVMVTGESFSRTEGPNTIVEEPIISTNLPLKLHQQGITLSLNYSSKKLQVKPFVTLQRTLVRDYAPYHNMPDAVPGVSTSIYSGMGTEAAHKSTPSVFGGASINYVPTSKLNINMNSYYYTAQTYHHLSNTLFNDGVRGIDTISAKLIVNLTASYEAVKGFHIFISGKNILNNRSREFFRSDEIPFRLMAGLNYEF